MQSAGKTRIDNRTLRFGNRRTALMGGDNRRGKRWQQRKQDNDRDSNERSLLHTNQRLLGTAIALKDIPLPARAAQFLQGR